MEHFAFIDEIQLMPFPFVSCSQLAKALFVKVHLSEKLYSENSTTFKVSLGRIGIGIPNFKRVYILVILAILLFCHPSVFSYLVVE